MSPKPLEKLDHLCRFLNSVRGTDKVLMLIQYASKIIIWKLRRGDPKDPLAQRVANLATPVGDFRILLRYYGLIPMLQWIVYSEANPSPNKKIQLLTRLQNVANVCYYPLEHLYWLGAHEVITMKPETRDKLGMWSCRFWMAYVVLYFAQLKEEYEDLMHHRQLLTDKLRKDVTPAEKDEIKKKLKGSADELKLWTVNTLINAAYLPLTLHWSLESSSFPDIGVGVFGSIASLGQLYLAWRASA